MTAEENDRELLDNADDTDGADDADENEALDELVTAAGLVAVGGFPVPAEPPQDVDRMIIETNNNRQRDLCA